MKNRIVANFFDVYLPTYFYFTIAIMEYSHYTTQYYEHWFRTSRVPTWNGAHLFGGQMGGVGLWSFGCVAGECNRCT